LIEVSRTSGNADAAGGVKATYHQTNSQQTNGQEQNMVFTGSGPVHVVADHAHLDRATDLTTFFGKVGEPARLWQASDSVVAPVLELSRPHSTLSAHGPDGKAAAVNAVFTGSPSSSQGASMAKAATSRANPLPRTPSVVRLQSRTLFYAESDHKAVFSGAVVAQTTSGLLHANFMDVYFTPAPGAQPGGKPSTSEQVSRIVARGAVELQQPGRKGTGEELTYTAADGQFLLTGSNAAPPRLADQVRGTVTGNALIFNDHDDSVVVSGGASKAVTQTRVAK
jgi:lipopolysaccharide export system protein LptA